MSEPIAFFYRKPVVLQFQAHQDLRFTPTGTAEFAAGQTAVPLVLAEFGEACHEYPIAFAKAGEGEWLAVALTGMRPGKNAYVTDTGKWDARYVPAAIRRYPFVLAKTGDEQFSVAADLEAPHFGKKGELIFESDGTPSEFMKSVLGLLEDFQIQASRTADLIRRLDAEGLLEETPVNLQTAQGQAIPLGSIWMVSEAKLLKAPESFLLGLAQSGELGFVYAHLLSVRRLTDLLDKTQNAGEEKKAVKSTSASSEKAKATAVAKKPAAKPRETAVSARKPVRKGRG